MKIFGNNGNKRRQNEYRESKPVRRPVRDEFDDARELEEHYSYSRQADEDIEHVIAQYQGRKKRRRKTILSVVCITVVVIIVAYKIWVQPPDLSDGGIGVASETPPVTTIEASKPPIATSAPDPINTVNPNEDRNVDAFTFVIAGRDYESGNTDTLLIGRFDTRNNKLDIVPIPRDTLANVGTTVDGHAQTTRKINTIFRDTGGLDAVEAKDGFLSGIRKILGFTVDCWAIIDLEAFEKLVDTIGGVDFDVPVHMVHEDYLQDLYIDIPKGMQHLDGKQALHVVRYRSYNDGDLGRISVQQDFMMTVAKQVLQIGNLTKMGDIVNVFTEYVSTDLTAKHFVFLGEAFLKLSSGDITFHQMPHTVPDNYYGEIRGVSYVILDLEPWLELVNNYLNPYYQDVTENDVDILLWDDLTQTATSTQGDSYTIYDFYNNPKS